MNEASKHIVHVQKRVRHGAGVVLEAMGGLVPFTPDDFGGRYELSIESRPLSVRLEVPEFEVGRFMHDLPPTAASILCR